MKRAFTLIELLVVIAIIAILAAILFPVFAQAKAAAKKTQDLSNFKQVSTGLAMYSIDFDDVNVPLMWSDAPFFVTYTWERDMTWPQLTFPYTKNWGIHRNPADGQANDAVSLRNMGYPATATGRQKEYAVGLNTSLGYNYMAFSPFNANAQFIGISNSMVTEPAGALRLADSIWDKAGNAPTGGGNWFIEAPHWSFSGTAYWFGGWQPCQTTNWLQYGGVWGFHAGRSNVAWGDTHATSMTPGQMLAGVTRSGDGCTISGVFDQDAYIWDRGRQ
jgi:prepilin-type N-terminal cleavage/methylation domain-containing protein/prepilin-type processing-associated H-X9-DG protein